MELVVLQVDPSEEIVVLQKLRKAHSLVPKWVVSFHELSAWSELLLVLSADWNCSSAAMSVSLLKNINAPEDNKEVENKK